MEKITGKVQAVSDKEGKYGINIEGTWVNGFGKPPANKGDEVEVEFEINGIYKNLKSIKVLNNTPEPKESKELDNTKLVSVLTSYAKDLTIAILQNDIAQKKTAKEAMTEASEIVLESYLKIKDKIN